MKYRFVLCVMALAIACAATGSEASLASGAGTGAVYAATNSVKGNSILAFRRAADGKMTYLASYATFGRGSGDGLSWGDSVCGGPSAAGSSSRRPGCGRPGRHVGGVVEHHRFERQLICDQRLGTDLIRCSLLAGGYGKWQVCLCRERRQQ